VLESRGFGKNPFEGRVAQWTKEEAAARYGQTLKGVGSIADLKTTKETNASGSESVPSLSTRSSWRRTLLG
jgi:hypothetical protein